MASWVRQRAEQVQKEDERRRQEREWTIARERIIARKIRPLWEQFVACVEQDVNEINKEFSFDPGRKAEFSTSDNPPQIRVHKSHYPAIRLNVILDEPSQRIAVLYEITLHSDASTQEEHGGGFAFDLDDKGDLYLTRKGQPVTCSEASQFLLERIISPVKHL
jgi:hypothetical protein